LATICGRAVFTGLTVYLRLGGAVDGCGRQIPLGGGLGRRGVGGSQQATQTAIRAITEAASIARLLPFV